MKHGLALLFLLTTMMVQAADNRRIPLSSVTLVRSTLPLVEIRADGSLEIFEEHRMIVVDGLESDSQIYREDAQVQEITLLLEEGRAIQSPIFTKLKILKTGTLEYLKIQGSKGEDIVVAEVDYKGIVRFLPEFQATYAYDTSDEEIKITLQRKGN
jgi:hypothetical protein